MTEDPVPVSRNEQIFQRSLEVVNSSALAREFGLTRERVRMIVKRERAKRNLPERAFKGKKVALFPHTVSGSISREAMEYCERYCSKFQMPESQLVRMALEEFKGNHPIPEKEAVIVTGTTASPTITIKE